MATTNTRFCLVVGLLGFAPHIPAAVFNIADGDVPGLVAAINTANNNREDDVINLAAGGTYTLVAAVDGENGLPPISYDGQFSGFHSLTINGNGATIKRSTAPGTPEFRLLAVYNRAAGSVCTISQVTFSNGRWMTSTGGGLNAAANLVLIDCTISDCSALRGGGIASANGGLQMRNCAIFNNYSDSVGGGLANGPEANVSADAGLINCTFAQNSARVKAGAISNDGGYVSGRGGATVTLTHCTIQGGGIYNSSFNNRGVVTFDNTILDRVPLELYSNAGNTSGKFVSNGHNLSSDGASGYFNGPGDLINNSPHFDPLGLQFNGGRTKCLALTAASPAIDRGTAAGTTTDQRGYARPLDILAFPNAADGDGSDIGAYEDAGDPVQESPLVVNSLDDHDDGVAGARDCTLREAVARANILGVARITFAPGLTGSISLNRALGELVVGGHTSIDGPGARALAVSGLGYIRVFTIVSGSLDLSRLTIRDGSRASGNVGDSNEGGGIYNGAILTLTDCALVHHVVLGKQGASGGGSGGSARGAAIFNNGQLSVLRCTFTGCVAGGGSGTDDPNDFGFGGIGGAAEGGAVYSTAAGIVTVTDSTFDANSAGGGGGGRGRFGGRGGNGTGAAIHNLGALTILNSTVTGNYGGGGPGGAGIGPENQGVYGNGNGGLFNAGTATCLSVLCAGNQSLGYYSAADASGTFVSQGFNLLGTAGGSSGFTAATDQTGSDAAKIDPLLAPLQNNGGDTDTRVPLAGSPAIDRGKLDSARRDQRGAVRPVDLPTVANAPDGDGSDIGAVEVDGAQPGAQIEVTTLDDHDDGVPGYFDCSLREAIGAANGRSGPTTITFRPGLRGTLRIVPALGTFAISNSISLFGPGARHLVIDGGAQVPLFHVVAGSNSIAGLTLSNGKAANTSSRQASGGAILNEAVLQVSDCSISNCIAIGPAALLAGTTGSTGSGGGIANTAGAILRIGRCAFFGNLAQGGDGRATARNGRPGGVGEGGAIFNDTNATLEVENCSFSSNVALGGAGGFGVVVGGDGGKAFGGAIANSGSMTLTSLTISGNQSTGGPGGDSDFPGPPGIGFGGGIASMEASLSNAVRNSIVAANVSIGTNALDVVGAFTSGGFNLVGDPTASSGFGMPGDQVGTAGSALDARLGPFANNGGPTDSFAPLAGSLALDHGQAFGLFTDQRGVARTFNAPAIDDGPNSDGTDIGAVEQRPAHAGPPVILSLSLAGDDRLILLEGTPGAGYLLQASPFLDLPFVNITPAAAADGLGHVEFIDSTSGPERFYRAVSVGP